MDPLIITQPDNGGSCTLNRPMTSNEQIHLLAQHLVGEVSSFHVMKVFEADHELRAELMRRALTLIRDGDKMDYRAWAKSVASAGLRGDTWLKSVDFPLVDGD